MEAVTSSGGGRKQDAAKETFYKKKCSNLVFISKSPTALLNLSSVVSAGPYNSAMLVRLRSVLQFTSQWFASALFTT